MSLNLSQQINLAEWFATNENRLAFKKQLPRGYAKIVANETEYSLSAIYKLMAGVYFNLQLLVKLIEIANKHCEDKNKLNQQGSTLLKQLLHEKDEHQKGGSQNSVPIS